MQSIARHRYPMMVWREGERFLWNPIHRKALKNRPEERVRLRVIDYLVHAGWSKHRITTEEAIRHYTQPGLRTDIICYNQTFDPQILIECKAESIAISGKTATQIARYNQQVKAPYVLMSNGIEDFWYQVNRENQQVTPLGQLPGILPVPDQKFIPGFSYWEQRGFAGSKASPSLRGWLEAVLPVFDSTKKTDSIQYLTFRSSPSDLPLDHYYLISSQKEYNIALSFMNTAFGDSRMTGIINRDGENIGIIEVNLDLVFEEEHVNTSIYSSAGTRNLDIVKESAIPFSANDAMPDAELSIELLKLWQTIAG